MSDNEYYIDIFCSGEIRRIPKAIWFGMHGIKPLYPVDFICNGCTMSPDMILDKRTWPACVLHDYAYNSKYATIDRKYADEDFKFNIQFCLEADGMLSILAKAIAYFYYRQVRRCGRQYYNGKGDPT